jgi:hypothetical protein
MESKLTNQFNLRLLQAVDVKQEVHISLGKFETLRIMHFEFIEFVERCARHVMWED